VPREETVTELLVLIADVGLSLVRTWVQAVRSGDHEAAARASRIIAETAAAKAAIRAARRR
jgi:hypothetical protein